MGVNIREGKISDLIKADINPVKRTTKAKKAIVDSLNEFGFARSIVVDEAGNIISGNGTTEGAEAIGMENVIYIESDQNTVIAHVVKNLTEEQKYRLAMKDNSTAKLAIWDAESLKDIHYNKGVSIENIFTESEFEKLTKEKPDVFTQEKNTNNEEEGELGYYVIVECGTQNEQELLFGMLEEEGYQPRLYEQPKR